ncbi:hypothetical protein P4O66_004037 [Electrophorus voltai]|uniref:Guanylate kinase-like domain-containing protein n=1 Tax=Electrophorus voltai TaxID=2609070 RepID=A0AAD9E2Z8_9TELE|nr:hypothetical protein P4O66_004037 [Electrophorus voltai]
MGVPLNACREEHKTKSQALLLPRKEDALIGTGKVAVWHSKVLNTDLRHYLSLQFQKGSLDHKLQQVIRDNLYLRTVPCTTRQPREGEVPGLDYNFISVGEFRVLEESGLLLESGTYDGNYYGTPKPPTEPSPVQPDLVDQVLFDEDFDAEVQRKRTTSVSKMDRKDSAAPEEEDEDDRPVLNGLAGESRLPEATKVERFSTPTCLHTHYQTNVSLRFARRSPDQSLGLQPDVCLHFP